MQPSDGHGSLSPNRAARCVALACLTLLAACHGQRDDASAAAPPAPQAPPPVPLVPSEPKPTVTALPQALALPSPPAPSFLGRVPFAVALPPGVTTPEQQRPFFDTFSWQSFVALQWPASVASRGMPVQPDNPAVFLSAKAGSEYSVWGTYKDSFELFRQGKNRPTPWTSWARPINPCGSSAGNVHQKQLLRFTKSSDVLQIGNQAFSYPLIDQSLNYAVYEVRLNQSQYEFVRGADATPSSWLYLAKNLAAKEPVGMPASSSPTVQGAIMVKAAWKLLVPGVDDASRYYATDASVFDPQSKQCKTQRVGLIGFHISQKTKQSPAWVWSTFEQVDNVPPASGPTAGQHYSFNNGTNTPETAGGWASRPPALSPQLQPVSERKAVQVTRLNAIPSDTAAVNTAWQTALKGTVWQYYQLVATQWPSTPNVFKTPEAGGIYPQDCGGAFPAKGVTNTVMETYYQSASDAEGAGGNSCMSCHYQAAQGDFSWTLVRGAH